jgi:polyisoprenoid-binding protein YceI
VNFAEEETSSNDKVKVKGSLIIKRTVFGVGQGEWASTKEVKDDVVVDFVVTAVKK